MDDQFERAHQALTNGAELRVSEIHVTRMSGDRLPGTGVDQAYVQAMLDRVHDGKLGCLFVRNDDGTVDWIIFNGTEADAAALCARMASLRSQGQA